MEGNERSRPDNFERLPDGRPEWVEAVGGLDEAEERLVSFSREFFGGVFHLFSREQTLSTAQIKR